MRLGTLILSCAAAALALMAQGAQGSFLSRSTGPRACMVRSGPQPASDFARFMAVRGGMQVRPCVYIHTIAGWLAGWIDPRGWVH